MMKISMFFAAACTSAALAFASPAFADDPYSSSSSGFNNNPNPNPNSVTFEIMGGGASNGGGNAFGDYTYLEGTATSIEQFDANSTFDINGCAEIDCATTALDASITGTQGVDVNALTSGDTAGEVMGSNLFGNGQIYGQFAFGDGETLRSTGAEAITFGMAQQRGVGYGDTVTYTGDQTLLTTAGLGMSFNGSPCDLGNCPEADGSGGTVLGANGTMHYLGNQELTANGIGSVSVHGQTHFGANMGLGVFTTVSPIPAD